MAERRMFAKTIIDSDAFIDMPLSTQALYFHLSMRADDDGFINNSKRIQKMIGASDDDLKLLYVKNFVIPFDTGIVVIKHWKIHNYIQKDRYKETVYLEEKSLLETKQNNGYTLKNELGVQNGYIMDTQVRLELDKNSIDKSKNSIEIYSPAEAEQCTIPYKEICDYLNKLTNSNYRYSTKKTKDLIKARFNEGFTLEDFKTVIQKKTIDWINDKEFKKYLRPETLFGSKFESYLNQPTKELTTKDLSLDLSDFFN